MPYGSKHLERVVAVAAIAGCVRLAKRTRKLQYPLAALGISALLAGLAFHAGPAIRLSAVSALAAGLWTELANVCRTLRTAWNKATLADRRAAVAGAGLIAAFALFVVFTTAFGLFRFLPNLFESYRADLEARQPAYQWIAQNAPPQARIYAYDDPLLFLYTGRKSCSLPIPPKLYYHNDQAGIDKMLDSIPDFAREYDLTLRAGHSRRLLP